jgi:heme-degrading monooxygenase HmoA
MITRVWHGKTSVENADKYLNFLLSEGTREYRETRGNISVKVWRKIEHDHCDFYTVTEWESIEAVKAFAGTDYEKAVYYPEDEGVLLEFEETVDHYEGYDVSAAK